jgi:zinc transport system substrate-binding protein
MRTVLVLAVLVALLGAGCGRSGRAADGRTSVVAGFYPLAYAASETGNGRVDVTNLTPTGAEPHDVELSARDVERVRSAGVVLLLGETFQPALTAAADGAEGTVVDALSGTQLVDRDPHVWLDPVRYQRIVRRVARSLPAGDPEPLVRRLRTLDADFRTGLADCDRRMIVTSHAAFGYLARRYGLRQVAITGLAPETEPSPQDLERVVREVERAGATTVFTERLVSPRLAETVARETGATTAVLDPIEGLTEQQAEMREDYVSLMRRNLAALRKALGCR